jgi:FixJ family two-component response regulator
MFTAKSRTPEIVYIIDDDEAIRDSLQWLLEAKGYSVSCHENADRFFQTLENTDQPIIACAIMDIRMPGMPGMELHAKLSQSEYRMPTILMTGHGDISMAVEAMKQGAMDFIQKPFREEELEKVIERMLEQARLESKKSLVSSEAQKLLGTLTPREIQVLDRIVAGRMNKQVANDLGISLKTVEAHRANIMDKLKVRTAADLLRTVITNQTSSPQANPTSLAS